jgi:hypothetical protein
LVEKVAVFFQKLAMFPQKAAVFSLTFRFAWEKT